MTDQPIRPLSLFDHHRIPSPSTYLCLIVYFPVGLFVFLCRIFLGFHTFLVACVLRKSALWRQAVLRVMCALLGVVVTQSGKRDDTVRMLCANHVSALDHLAVDLVQSCILPSVWDIPAFLRWCFGYADLGAGSGRPELVKRAKEHIRGNELPLLSFPEGAITNGRVALLKFNSWPMEVSSFIQPIALSVSRPFSVSPAHLGSSWWNDCLWFLALPYSVIHVQWLPVMRRAEEEDVEVFASRVGYAIAQALSISVSNVNNVEAAEATRRHLSRISAPVLKVEPLTARRMDEVTMKIKQSYPTISLLAIRNDLEKTKSQKVTLERIKAGLLNTLVSTKTSEGDYRAIFISRKWHMIEANRAKYLAKMQESGAGDSL